MFSRGDQGTLPVERYIDCSILLNILLNTYQNYDYQYCSPVVFQYWAIGHVFFQLLSEDNPRPFLGLKPLCCLLVGPLASPCTACSSCSPTPLASRVASPLARRSTSSPSSPSHPSPSSPREPCRCSAGVPPATVLAPPGGEPGNRCISSNFRIGHQIGQQGATHRKPQMQSL